MFPSIQLSHSNGFPFACYQTFIEHLAPHPVRGISHFGLTPSRRGENWKAFVPDLIAHIEAGGQGPVVGVGHSLGGVVTFWAAMQRPDLFSKVIMIDPPMFGRNKRALFALFSLLGLAGKVVPPAKKARYRRTHFPTREEARHYFASKRLFHPFEPSCLDHYVEHGLQPSADGKGVTLTVPASLEYQIFCGTPYRLGNTLLPMPSYFLYSEKYEVLERSDVAWLRGAFRNTEFISFPEGHMLPMEAPEKAARMIKELIFQDKRHTT